MVGGEREREVICHGEEREVVVVGRES